MKGIVFNLLEEVVSRHLGPDAWDDLIDAAGVSGIYSSLGNYPDSEIEALVEAASGATSMDRNAVLRWFGQNGIPVLAELYPDFFEVADLPTFISGINTTIHAEVHKLYPGSRCPHFQMHQVTNGDLVMDYISNRQMCALAQGFIEGAAVWFGQQIAFEHTACTRTGAKSCQFIIHYGIERPKDAKAA